MLRPIVLSSDRALHSEPRMEAPVVQATSSPSRSFCVAGAEHTEGETAPLVFARTAFSARHYQQITRVTIGDLCGVKADMSTFFESSAPPTNAWIVGKPARAISAGSLAR